MIAQKNATVNRQERPNYPGRLTFYHPNAKGSGVAARFELRLNGGGNDRYDCFFLDMARQLAPAEGRAAGGPAAFDWARRATVKLDFADICELLLVLEGRKERAGANGGNGIYHQAGDSTTLIEFRRDAERHGYLLGVSRKTKHGESVFRGQMLLTDAEAIGLRCVFQTGLFFMVFHQNLRPRGAVDRNSTAGATDTGNTRTSERR